MRATGAAPLPLASRIGLLCFILAVSSLVAFLIPHFFDIAQRRYSLATLIGGSVDFSFDLSVSFSRYISRLSTSRQQFHNHHGGEISGFRSSFPSFLFPFTRYKFASWRAAIRAHDEWLFRRASSSIVNVFLLLHPSMPTALPSINISFHLSGSSLSLDVALSSLAASPLPRPSRYPRPRDLPRSSFFFSPLLLPSFTSSSSSPFILLGRCLRWSGRVHATSVQVLFI